MQAAFKHISKLFFKFVLHVCEIESKMAKMLKIHEI